LLSKVEKVDPQVVQGLKMKIEKLEKEVAVVKR
jgi:hypothetical protein